MTPPVIGQMSCGGTAPLEGVGAAEFIQAMICTYAGAGAMSFTAFGLVVWFTISSMTYARQQSLTMPIVYLLVLGGTVLTMVPSVGLGIAAILLLGGGAGLVVLMLRRADRV